MSYFFVGSFSTRRCTIKIAILQGDSSQSRKSRIYSKEVLNFQ